MATTKRNLNQISNTNIKKVRGQQNQPGAPVPIDPLKEYTKNINKLTIDTFGSKSNMQKAQRGQFGQTGLNAYKYYNKNIEKLAKKNPEGARLHQEKLNQQKIKRSEYNKQYRQERKYMEKHPIKSFFQQKNKEINAAKKSPKKNAKMMEQRIAYVGDAIESIINSLKIR